MIVNADVMHELVEVSSVPDAVMLPRGFDVVPELLIGEEELTGSIQLGQHGATRA